MWIKRLKTQYPYGLNTTERRMGNAVSTYSLFDRNNRQHNRGRRKKRSERNIIQADLFIADMHKQHNINPREALRQTHNITMTTQKKNLRNIYHAMLNRNSCILDPMIRDMCIHRLNIKQTNVEPKPKITKHSMNIDYDNKHFDHIQYFKIFKINNIIKYKPHDVSKESLLPSIRYNYTTPFGLKVFNFKEAATVLLDNNHDDTKELCKCHHYKQFIDTKHKHVVNGSIDIVSNLNLKQILQQGPKFRLPKQPNIKILRYNPFDGIRTYIKRQIDKQLHNKSFWLEVQNIWTKNANNEINAITNNINNTYRSKFNFADSENKALEKLKSDFVISTVDKAGQNYSFICKHFYLSTIHRMLNDNQPNPTYIRTDLTPTEANTYITNTSFNMHNIKVSNNYNLPYIHLIPKFHKDPIDFRAIIASKHASTKPISEIVCKALKLVQENIRKYCKVIHQN